MPYRLRIPTLACRLIWKNNSPIWQTKLAGFQAAIKPLSLYLVYQTAKAVSIPVIGVGGIACADDALEYLMAGAKAVQIGTANFLDPSVTMKTLAGIEEYCRSQRLGKIADLKTIA